MGVNERSELQAPGFTNVDNHLYTVTGSFPCKNWSTQHCVQPSPSKVQLFVDNSGDHQFEIPSNGSDILHCPDAGKKLECGWKDVRDLESLWLLRKEFLPK